MKLLGKTANEQTVLVNETYEEIFQQIQVTPSNAEELVELKKYCDSCPEKVAPDPPGPTPPARAVGCLVPNTPRPLRWCCFGCH